MFMLLIDLFLYISDKSQVLYWPCQFKRILQISPQIHDTLILYFNCGKFLLLTSMVRTNSQVLPKAVLLCLPPLLPCLKKCLKSWWGLWRGGGANSQQQQRGDQGQLPSTPVREGEHQVGLPFQREAFQVRARLGWEGCIRVYCFLFLTLRKCVCFHSCFFNNQDNPH